MKRSDCLYAICLTAATLLAACGEKEYVYPDLVTEIACLDTDDKGFGIRIVTDEGTVWRLSKGNRPDSLTADSTYRVLAKFAPRNDDEATAYTLQKVISPLPKPGSEYPVIRTDPVRIQSVWRSGEYLNMVLQVMVKDRPHSLSFIENGIETDADGRQTLTLTLYHDRNEDAEAFYRKSYLSVPLWHYQGRLAKGDRIVLQLNTYEEGTVTRNFIY